MKKFVRTHPPHSPPRDTPARNGLGPHGKANGASSGGVSAPAGGSRLSELHSTLSSRRWAGSEGLWEDPDFPRALPGRKLASGVLWLRPHEVSPAPRFRGDDAVRGAPEPPPEPPEQFAARWRAEVGAAGSPALVGAAAALARCPRLMSRVAPHQSFQHRYTGAFRFSFCVWGVWREVVVDDRLPWRGGRLLASRGGLADDYTLPLLEKAYAKLYGGYGALPGGGAEALSLALGELSGAVAQAVALGAPARAAPVLRAAAPRATLLLATTNTLTGPGAAAFLVTGAGAGAVRVRRVAGREGGEARLQGPVEHDDEYWMSLEELCRVCGHVCLAHVGPDEWAREPALRARRPWRAVIARRHWRAGYNAGGPPHTECGSCNPRFDVSVGGGAEPGVHVVVSVSQPRGRRGRLLAVGAALSRADGAALPALSALARAREVASFAALPAGRYVLVAHTARPHEEGDFLLRVLCDARLDVTEHNDDNVIARPLSSLFPPTPGPGAEGAGLDARAVRAALGGWRRGRPPQALCRALVALRDAGTTGRAPAQDLPAMRALLDFWKAEFRSAGGGCGGVPCHLVRRALLACGVRVSNKALEVVALRWAELSRARATLGRDGFLCALASLHLAHERYRALEARLKNCPISLEEMILMTVYS